MTNPRLAIRYAKSLINLAQEQKNLEEVYKDVRFLERVCNSNRDFVNVLKSPIIKPDKKYAIISSITKGNISELTNSFLRLLSIKGRELNLPEIIGAFIEQYNTIKGIKKAKLTTAVPISNEIKSSFMSKLKTNGVNLVDLEEVVNPEIIGGFVLETEGKLVDASIARDLREVKKQFMNNDYVHKLR
jgi:F-type H+-transporting ATPase subunit delta